MPKHKWDNPQEWLNSVVQTHVANNDVNALVGIINSLVQKVNSDDIQDEFQNDMERDGYFKTTEDAAVRYGGFYKPSDPAEKRSPGWNTYVLTPKSDRAIAWVEDNIPDSQERDGDDVIFVDEEKMRLTVHLMEQAKFDVDKFEGYDSWNGPSNTIERVFWIRSERPTFERWLQMKKEAAAAASAEAATSDADREGRKKENRRKKK
jgi:hypothetical protein